MILFQFGRQKKPTLPETNIAPETLGLEDEFPFGPLGLLPGAMLAVSFWECFFDTSTVHQLPNIIPTLK